MRTRARELSAMKASEKLVLRRPKADSPSNARYVSPHDTQVHTGTPQYLRKPTKAIHIHNNSNHANSKTAISEISKISELTKHKTLAKRKTPAERICPAGCGKEFKRTVPSLGVSRRLSNYVTQWHAVAGQLISGSQLVWSMRSWKLIGRRTTPVCREQN